MPQIQFTNGAISRDNEYKSINLTSSIPNIVTFTENGIKPTLNKNNQLICGDNLSRLKTIENDTIDLIYCDPLFLSGRKFECVDDDTNETRELNDTIEAHKIDNNDNDQKNIYASVENINIYLNNQIPVYRELYRILKSSGSFYFHCDYRIVHYVKTYLDKIFGYDNFRNEIIWCYHGGGKAKYQFKRKHDNILFYTKSNIYTFNIPTIDRGYMKYYKKGVPIHSMGKTIEDWWADIPSRGTASRSKEWLDYPTQKPERLLERIIKASSNELDVVLDPFCGSGTTLLVAKNLNRHYIGIDLSTDAIRMSANRVDFPIEKIEGIYTTPYDLKNITWQAYQQWVCNKMQARNIFPNIKDGGVDGIVNSTFNTLSYSGAPIQVKHSDDVGVGVVKEFKTTMDTKKIGFIVAHSFTSGAIEQCAKHKLFDNVEIRLITTTELCKTNFYKFI